MLTRRRYPFWALLLTLGWPVLAPAEGFRTAKVVGRPRPLQVQKRTSTSGMRVTTMSDGREGIFKPDQTLPVFGQLSRNELTVPLVSGMLWRKRADAVATRPEVLESKPGTLQRRVDGMISLADLFRSSSQTTALERLDWPSVHRLAITAYVVNNIDMHSGNVGLVPVDKDPHGRLQARGFDNGLSFAPPDFVRQVNTRDPLPPGARLFNPWAAMLVPAQRSTTEFKSNLYLLVAMGAANKQQLSRDDLRSVRAVAPAVLERLLVKKGYAPKTAAECADRLRAVQRLGLRALFEQAPRGLDAKVKSVGLEAVERLAE